MIPFKQYWQLLARYLRPQLPKVILLAVLILGSVGMTIINPQILRSFIDAARAGAPDDTLFNTALLFIGVVLIGQVFSALAAYFSEDVGWTATNLLRVDLALHCLQLDMTFHKERPPGELIERIDGDVTILSNFFSQFTIRVLANLLLLGCVLLLLFREDWRVGASVSVIALLSLESLRRVRNLAVPYFLAVRQTTAEILGFWEEWLASTEDVRANGAQGYLMRRLLQVLRTLTQQGRMAMLMDRTTWSISEILYAASNASLFALGAYLLNGGQLSIGTVYIVFFYVDLLFLNLVGITRQLEDLQFATAGIERIGKLYQTRNAVQDGPGAALTPTAPAVTFDAVSFSYVAAAPVLQQISLAVPPGAVLGLLGRTGSGKTTLARLLFRFYDPTTGRILLDGIDIRQAKVAELRQHIGMVTQDVQLFHATLRDNLTFFDRSIPDERIVETLRELGLWQWYDGLPVGLDTPLMSGGGVSAGEAQLLAFARVFLKNPGLVILDEASSRLDPATEQLVQRAVDRLFHGRTAIIIAHRLKTIERADQIMILESGQVVEYGARERLAAAPDSHFARLLRTGVEELSA
jgi:ATP-binding cassette, subfamily B, bacterial